MKTKTAYDITGTVVTVEWSWLRNGEIEIEEIDGETDFSHFSDEAIESIREACADDYPFAQYQSDCAEDAEYYDR
ncbi:hypothetical protein M0Q28_06055 [Patescibacteria group bacterium]|jgi:hypothetical protein|nr:hypothetical protein [Patescibacteria group bacterium]